QLRVRPDDVEALEEVADQADEGELAEVLVAFRRAINVCEDAARLEAILKRGRQIAARAGKEAFAFSALVAASQSAMAGSAQATRVLAKLTLEDPKFVGGEAQRKEIIALVERQAQTAGASASTSNAELAH